MVRAITVSDAVGATRVLMPRRMMARQATIMMMTMMTTTMRNALRILLTATIFACSPGRAQVPPAVSQPHDPMLRHHLVRPDQLAPPYATSSSANPPIVMAPSSDARLHLPPGFHIAVYASGLDGPRTMIEAPNGDVIVAETAGGRISILRGGKPFVFVKGLDEPYGLALHQQWLYVGNENAVIRFDYRPGQLEAGAPQQVAPLPPGGHSTRGLQFNRDHTKLYVSIGSNSNDSVEAPPRAAITEMNPDGSGRRIFASGLRNPVGMALNPANGALWTAVNERDGLGDDLVPDYATEVRDGEFFGWPYAYIGRNVDPRHRGERPDLVAKSVVPSVLIESHSAPLGIAFYDGTMFPPQYRGAAFVALHGSWNRSARTGYEVIAIPFHNGQPAGGYDDFVAGWMTDPHARRVWGRPVGLLVLRDGSLLVSDDGAGRIWRITYGP